MLFTKPNSHDQQPFSYRALTTSPDSLPERHENTSNLLIFWILMAFLLWLTSTQLLSPPPYQLPEAPPPKKPDPPEDHDEPELPEPMVKPPILALPLVSRSFFAFWYQSVFRM